MNVLGILRGFPGLGRVVSGTAILETLRDEYNCNIEIISYLQGQNFLEKRGHVKECDVTPLDYCSIGLLPTNKMGAYIHQRIKKFHPDIVIIDGEPLILHSLRISYPNLKIVSLLNPSDVDNPQNDVEAMDFFTSMYSLSNLAIVHGLRGVETDKYKSIISINTSLRKEILNIKNVPTPNIYCVLGGGTVNVGAQFAESTIQMAKLCVEAASYLKDYTMHIICSSDNIYKKLSSGVPTNVQLHKEIIDSEEYYSKACLVITRSGRNTLSELAYLGIPAISFVSGCSYRKAEQEQNLKSLNATNICSAEIDISAKDFADLCIKQQSYRQECPKFIIGNLTAVSEILSL